MLHLLQIAHLVLVVYPDRILHGFEGVLLGLILFGGLLVYLQHRTRKDARIL